MRWFFHLIIPLLYLELSAQTYSRVQIWLSPEKNIGQLATLGLDLDHGHHQPGKYFISEFSEEEINNIAKAGFELKVLIPDLNAELHKQNNTVFLKERTQASCYDWSTSLPPKTPRQYTYGSMGGYHTYGELLDVLDTMAARYPKIFKKRQPIDSLLLTHEGRPVFWVKISDNPHLDEDKPEALYTALHHAREPNSLSQLLFFMWYLLENYDENREVKYLVDNTELYFVPCVNPDGYIYNEITNPEGGGYWRKNRRDNHDGSFGVDINRNYNFEWGYDDLGSSSASESQTYRGILPSSEPETQLMQKFCKERNFRIALNHHTFGNVLLYPWGYADSTTAKHPVFRTYAELMVRDNSYNFGLSTRTLGYTANGTSDDWMFGDTIGKTQILAFTPEIGSSGFGFWPARADIDFLNKDAFSMNLSAAHLLLNYAELRHSESPYIAQKEGSIGFLLRSLGLQEGVVKISLTAQDGVFLSTGEPLEFKLKQLEEEAGAIQFTLNPGIRNGDSIHFELLVDNGLFVFRHPFTKIFSEHIQTAFSDSASELSKWTIFGQWGLSSEYYYSPPSSITDSPSGFYKPNTLSEISTKEPVIIKNAKAAILSFWARWDIEEDEDYAMAMISVNGGTYQPLCGKYTESGTYEQAFNQPLYDGTQPFWVKEEIDITEYLTGDSTALSFLFRMKADEFIEKDGFYFDDLLLTVVGKSGVSASSNFDRSSLKFKSYPNPAKDFTQIEFSSVLPDFQSSTIQVFNLLGQMKQEQQLTSPKHVILSTAGWDQGFYFYRICMPSRIMQGGRFLIQK